LKLQPGQQGKKQHTRSAVFKKMTLTVVLSVTNQLSQAITKVSEKPGPSIFWAEVQTKAPTRH